MWTKQVVFPSGFPEELREMVKRNMRNHFHKGNKERGFVYGELQEERDGNKITFFAHKA